MSRTPRAIQAVALLALLHGVLALGVAVLMMASGLRGLPITTPVQLLEPETPFLQPGVPLDLMPGAPSLPVTEELVRAVAAGNIGLFAGSGLLWLLAAAGLWGRRRSAWILALVLFTGLALVSLLNLAVEAMVLVLAGDMIRATGGMVTAVVMMAAFAALAGASLAAVAILALPAGAAAFRGTVAPRRPAVVSLIFHFSLVAVLLLPGVLAPASLWPAWILVGPWPLAGLAARLVTLLLAGSHAACAWGWWHARRWTVPLSLWLNVVLVLLAWSSALWADDGSMEMLGAGLLPAQALRAVLVVAGVLGCSLLLAIRLAGRQLPRAPGSRSA